MADQNININSKTALDDIKVLKRAIDKLIEEEVDFNEALKTQSKLLKEIGKDYSKIEARLYAIKNTTIDVKSVEKELNKSLQTQFLTKKNLEDIEKEFSEATQAQIKESEELINKLTRERGVLTDKQIKAGFGGLELKKAQIELEKKSNEMSANIELQAYEAAKKAYEISQKQVVETEKRLKFEKDSSKQLGISGNLIKAFSDKLGIGESIYEAMSAKSKELVADQGKVTNAGKWKVAGAGIKAIFKSAGEGLSDPAFWLVAGSKIGKIIGKSISSGLSAAGGFMSGLGGPDAANTVSKLTSGFSGFLKNIPLIGGLLGGAVDLMSGFVDMTINASSNIQKMGRELGISAGEALKLSNRFSNFANNSNDVLLNSRKLFESQIELSKQMGVIVNLSNEQLQTDIRLKDIAGLDLDTRTNLAENAVIQNRNQKDILNSVFAQVEGLKQATGIQFNQKQILGEVSKLSGYLGLSFAKYPSELTKSLVTVKAMGIELKQLDSIADSFLDFESSITNEFEAQVLTGKNINLNKARELFLNNDLAGAAQEITSQVGSASDFLNLNRIQAESIAKAFGMTRDTMGDMLRKQELMSKIGAKDTDNAREQYQLALKKYGTQKAMSDALGEEAANAIVSANANERIAAFIDKIKQGFSDLVANSGVTQFIDKAINWVSDPKNIQTMISKIQGFFATVLDVTGSVVGGIMKFLNIFPGINIDRSLIDLVENAGAGVRGFSIGALPTSAPSIGSMVAANSAIPTSNSAPLSTVSKGGMGGPIVLYSTTNLIQDGQVTATVNQRTSDISSTPNYDNRTGK
jgi:hypothetical protein